MSEELKLEACPFCGATIKPGRLIGHMASHPDSDDCPLSGMSFCGSTWNRRAPSAPSPEFAALVEAVSELTKHARVEMIDGEPTVFVNGVLMCSPATSRVIYDLRAAAERALKGGGRG